MQSQLPFSSRRQAAELLAQKLSQYKDKRPLVVGIPRGSVLMAKVIADKLGGDLDVVLVHKIGAPYNPEFAIGSVSEFGTTFHSSDSATDIATDLADGFKSFHESKGYFERSAKDEIAKLKQRRKMYSPVRPPINPKDRIVIIVDDGIATGSTMLAAIHAIRFQNPQKIVIASPVAPQRVVESFRSQGNEVVVLEMPDEFYSISQFYEFFPQVDDQEVIQLLQ